MRPIDADALNHALYERIAHWQQMRACFTGDLAERCGIVLNMLRSVVVAVNAAPTIGCETCDLNPPCKRGELSGCDQWKARSVK